MAFFAVLGLILLMGISGRRPNRVSYALVGIAAAGASAYEYFFK
jgi:hypothetical protein